MCVCVHFENYIFFFHLLQFFFFQTLFILIFNTSPLVSLRCAPWIWSFNPETSRSFFTGFWNRFDGLYLFSPIIPSWPWVLHNNLPTKLRPPTCCPPLVGFALFYELQILFKISFAAHFDIFLPRYCQYYQINLPCLVDQIIKSRRMVVVAICLGSR